ncbi:MAG: adenylate/guanylate cyclase domain-containing protein [Candidatus Binatia bacterium]
MKCLVCQSQNADDSFYCDECGGALEAVCPGCGAGNRPTARFCRKCRASLGASPAAPESVEPPSHLAEKILRSRSALEGERKHVTVLFADVKGSMDLAESMDPEDWSRIMQGFFRRLVAGVERFEGYVDKFTGDGIMALFGAPLAHEDHAQRACFAALNLRDAAREYANDVRLQYGVPFEVRIGLNSGEVVVGRIGDDSRMDFTAQGHTVGLAQRMEALAESGHIYLSDQTARLVEGYFQLRELGRTQVKGVGEPVGLFDLEGVGEFRTRLDRSRSRGLSAFVGRERDVAVLESALERARGGGGGQVVGVVAEAGTGKSRLCAEFLDSCRSRGIPVLEARGVAHGKSVPMLPMLELWRGFYGVSDADTADVVRAKIAGRLLLMDEGFREALPILFDVLGVADPEHPSPVLDPEQRQKRVHALARRILHDPGYGGTRVMLLEDLHWFDGASDSFLDTFVESLPATRDLWIVNFRPEYQVRWMQRSYYQHLPLQPLGAEAIEALLCDHLGSDRSVAALPALIQERTRGNPFFIEELVQSLVENGQLRGCRGDYRLTIPVASLAVPSTVQALLAARMDRLGKREKEVLQIAAVIGKDFAESLLQRVLARLTTLDDAVLADCLSTLAAAEFLFEASLYPRVVYSFKHPLTQEVAQRSQLSERRCRVHAAVAQSLEDAGDGLDERAAEIAGHWGEAGDRGAAARWSVRAAKWAALSDARESLQHWRRVRALTPAIVDVGERNDLAMQACDQILSFGWRMGDSEEEADAVFEEGRALASAIGDRSAEAMFVGRYGIMRMSVGGSGADYARYGDEALRLGSACGDPALVAAVGQYATWGQFYTGDGRLLLERAARVLEATGSDNTIGRALAGFSPRVSVLAASACALLRLGRFDEAETTIREAESAATESREDEVLTWTYAIWAQFAWALGTAGHLLDRARRSLEIAERLDNEVSRVCAHAALATAYLLDGQHEAARDAAQESCRISIEQRAQRGLLPEVLAILAEAHLALGDQPACLAVVRDAIDQAGRGGNGYYEAHAQIVLSRALLASNPVAPLDAIESALARAEKLVVSLDARALSPQILETRGRWAAARGEAARADELLREAFAFYRKIGATGHVDRLAGELGA